jgi:hypothetical protein
MGFAINLEKEHGEVLESIEDPTNILHRLLERCSEDDSHLGEIDWYGDTTFNRLQIPRFLTEWETLAQCKKSAEEAKFVAEVRRLAERCASGVHLYLKFVGD